MRPRRPEDGGPGSRWRPPHLCARNPGLPDRFKRQWRLTLLELEKKHRCEMCGSRNARVYPWWGNDKGGELGLEGPPGEGQ